VCNSEGNSLRIVEALTSLTGQPARVRFEQTAGPAVPKREAPAVASPQGPEVKSQIMNLPLFRHAREVLGAQVWHVEESFNPAALPRQTGTDAAAEDDSPAPPQDTEET
jgi:hypothetical protein